MRQHERVIKVVFLSSYALGVLVFGFAKLTNRLAPIDFSDNGLIQTFVQYNQYKLDQQKFKEIANMKITFEQLDRTFEHQKQETHVIIIGESTSKHHMSIYGYQRPTTPLLSKENLIIFTNAVSPNAHTVPALEKALTFKSRTNNNLGIENGSIIDIANQAGYETYWLSNQAFSGEHETPISVMASKANFKTYTNAIGTASSLDDKLQLPYEEALKTEKSKVIFVHLMGTHLSYDERYSNTFNLFKDNYNLADITWDATQQGYINAYDNAIAYNDKVVDDLLEELKKVKGNCTFTYFSDHGDEVYDFRNFHGHSDVLLSKYMYEIPLLFWANESYKLQRNVDMGMLENNSAGKLNTENLIHFWSDILDIHTEYYESKSSPISDNYQTDTTLKKLPIVQTTTQNNIDFENRLWCHRVNGIDRLNEAKKHFSGFEIDVVYQVEGWFDVNHPPAESIGLRLKQLIKSTLQPSKYNYWLDMKNLTVENSPNASKKLLTIAEEYNCKENIIVESACLSCLKEFDELGFKTAYYLPFLHDLSEGELYDELTRIENEMKVFQPSVITQERDGYVLLKKHFPYCHILSWDTQTEFTDASQLKNTQLFITTEKRLKVLLIRYDSNNWR
jgi:heptose-I-phosphate ethanolaminephosphotransferase